MFIKRADDWISLYNEARAENMSVDNTIQYIADNTKDSRLDGLALYPPEYIADLTHWVNMRIASNKRELKARKRR